MVAGMTSRPAPRPTAAGAPPPVPLWVAFVNTSAAPGADGSTDVLRDFDRFIAWLVDAAALDAERGPGIRRRAEQQPAGAAAVLVDARRVRAALRGLAESGASVGPGTAAAGGRRARVEGDALSEINRVLGRSAGMRRVERRADGRYARTFVTVGDAFASLLVPVVDSAAESLVVGGASRVRTCADPRCGRAFVDVTRNRGRRWCDMATCGNRAKAARHRRRAADPDAAQAGVGASFRYPISTA